MPLQLGCKVSEKVFCRYVGQQISVASISDYDDFEWVVVPIEISRFA